MNQYRKRITALEQKKKRSPTTPIVLAAITEYGEYAYEGKIYSEVQFAALMKKLNPNTIVLDDTKAKGRNCKERLSCMI
ncbi:MAG: hypothetical protein K2N44_18310 [Lachnospiraceae bacterium]|nr:hypothetical protein [Lachnospiraceae bacterium]